SAMTRLYYRVLDWWQTFAQTEVGRALYWFTPRALKAAWLLIKAMVVFYAAMMLMMLGTMGFMLLVLTGNGKAAINAFTKITLVAVGLFVALKVADGVKLNKLVQSIGR